MRVRIQTSDETEYVFNLFSTAVIIIAVVSMAYIWKAHLLPLPS
jgi:hypothetical protein